MAYDEMTDEQKALYDLLVEDSIPLSDIPRVIEAERGNLTDDQVRQVLGEITWESQWKWEPAPTAHEDQGNIDKVLEALTSVDPNEARLAIRQWLLDTTEYVPTPGEFMLAWTMLTDLKKEADDILFSITEQEN
jgi:hypothetical protein